LKPLTERQFEMPPFGEQVLFERVLLTGQLHDESALDTGQIQVLFDST
jgi:hypothetical protein